MASTPVATVVRPSTRDDHKLVSEWSSIGHLPSIAQASLITKGFGGDGFVDSVASHSFATSGTTLAIASKARIASLVATFAATLLRAWSQWVLESIMRRIPRLNGTGPSKVGSFTSLAFLLAAFKALHLTWKRCRQPLNGAADEPEACNSWTAGSVGGSLRRLRDAVVASPPPPPPSLALTTSEAASVLAQLESLRRVGNDGFGADLVLIAVPSMTEVPCHCCVLAASSAPLRELLLVSSGGDQRLPDPLANSSTMMPRRVELSVSADALQLLVAFVYGEAMEPPADVAGLEVLLAAATTLEVTPLVNQCAAALTRASTTPILACDALRLAHDCERGNAAGREPGGVGASVAASVSWVEVRALALACIAEHFEEVTAQPVSAALRSMRRHANRRQKAANATLQTENTSNDVGVADSEGDTDDESGNMGNSVTARALLPDFSRSSSNSARAQDRRGSTTSSFLELPEELLAEVLWRPELNCSETIVLAAVLAWLDHADADDRAELEERHFKVTEGSERHDEDNSYPFSPFDSPSYDARRRCRDISSLPWDGGPVPMTNSIPQRCLDCGDEDNTLVDSDSSNQGSGKRAMQLAAKAAERSKRALAWVQLDLVPATFLHVLVESHPRFAADPSLVLSAYRAQALRSDRNLHSTSAFAGILEPSGHSRRSCVRRARDNQVLPPAARAALEPPNKSQPWTARLGQWWLKWRAPPRLVASPPSAPLALPATPRAAPSASRASWTPPPPSSPPPASPRFWDTADD